MGSEGSEVLRERKERKKAAWRATQQKKKYQY
jgi:hypothetical protein